MLAHVLITLTLSALPPDYSKRYFPGLTQAHAKRVHVGREQGPVILVVVDALRPDRMSAYGAKRDTTPNLKKLAGDGVSFTNFFVNGNWTRPSTASLLTGVLPGVHGVERDRDRLADDFETLAERLQSKGIVTGAVVGNGNAGQAFGMHQGFDYYADTRKHWDGLPAAQDVVDLALPFVEKNKDKPFFLMMFMVDPHDPYHAPGDYEDMFVTDKSAPLVRSPHWERITYTPQQIERMKATYDGAVRYTDDALGGFFASLKSMGLYDDATIIVTSDHGEAFGEHGVFMHSHHFYDEIVRVPLIVRAPKMSRRGVYNHLLFQSLDIFPTVAGLYGLSVPSPVAGVDIVDALAHPYRQDPNRTIICEFKNFGINRWMIRDYERKIIYEEPADEKTFLSTVGDKKLLPTVSFDAIKIHMFHVGRDPFEQKNLYSKEALVWPKWNRMFEVLAAHRKETVSPEQIKVVEHLDPETYSDLKALGYIQ